MKGICVVVILCLCVGVSAQNTHRQRYDEFSNAVKSRYYNYRDSVNDNYAQFLENVWTSFETNEPLPKPQDEMLVPPIHYHSDDNSKPIEIYPVKEEVINNQPHPMPIAPIRENIKSDDAYFEVEFYGDTCKVRLPEVAKRPLESSNNREIAASWSRLSKGMMDNALRDCLEVRLRYRLCDWAYLEFIKKMCDEYCDDKNGATMLTAYLYCQSGYQMRLAVDGNTLILLYGSNHLIYEKEYLTINGINFYSIGKLSGSIKICDAPYPGEQPMSLIIKEEMRLGTEMTPPREIKSSKYPSVSVVSKVPQNLIDFYNGYPTSSVNGNQMTRWAMYANTPISAETRNMIYPSLQKSLVNCSPLDAVNRLLDFVQTGFVYELDDKIWGHDRAFFAEESLYYPYCDCEDRSILFSRLVRDLVCLDVALIYYPGHLATAVAFPGDVTGDAVVIDGKKFIICDPTYIGAPVGMQMPGLDYSSTRAIIL